MINLNKTFLLIAILTMGSQTSLASKAEESVSLESMFEYFTKGQSQEHVDQLLGEKEQISMEIDGRIGQGFGFNSEVEVFEDESVITLGVSETYKLGFDADLTRKRLRLEREIESQSSKISRSSQKMEVAALYSKIRLQKDLWDLKRDILLELEPLIKQADAAQSNGGAEALAVLKWKIMLDNQEGEKKILEHEFSSIVTGFNRLFGSKYSPDISNVKFSTVLETPKDEKFSSKSQPEIDLLRKKMEALTFQAKELDYYEISANIGYQTKSENESQAYIVGISLPLGEAANRSREVSKIKTERSLVESDLLRQQRVSHIRMESFQSTLSGLDKRRAVHQELVKSTSVIFNDAKKGFQRGITEFSTLIEAISAYDASRQSLVESNEAYRNAVFAFQSYMGDL